MDEISGVSQDGVLAFEGIVDGIAVAASLEPGLDAPWLSPETWK